MRHGRLSWITGTALLASLAMPFMGKAQENAQDHPERHKRYTFVDVGSLVGGFSSLTDINPRGTAAGASTIYDPACDCNVVHAIKWRKGIMTDLGTLSGGVNSAAGAINSHGAVLGQSENGLIDPVYGAPAFVATIWKDGEIKNLGTLGGGFSVPGVFGDGRPRDGSINDRGQAVGAAANTNADPEGFATELIFPGAYGFVPGNQWHATLWEHGITRDLGTLGDGPDSQAIFINERGQVAGNSYTDSIPTVYGIPTLHPFLWENGHMVDLGSLGGVYANANGLNNRGQVAGFSTLTGDLGGGHAFLWAHGAMRDLGDLGGDYSFSEANAINDDGEIAGHTSTADGAFRGFRWKHGVMTDLGSVPGYDCSNTGSINASGQIAGWAYLCDGSSVHAALWEKGRPGVDLNTLVPPGSGIELIEADFITDTGEITGFGFLPNGDEHAFLLIPKEEDDDDVAEPAADGSQSSTIVTHATLTPERLADLRARLASRHRGFELRPPKTSN